MTKTRTLLFIATSLVVGLFISACAGSTGSQAVTGNQVVTGGPIIQAWQVITINETVSREAGMWAGVYKSSLAHQAVERATQSLLHYGDCPFGGD